MEYVDGGGVVNITRGVCFTAGGLIGGLVAGAITGAVSSATLGLGSVLARFVGSIFAAGLTELINNALGGGGVYFTHTIRISKCWLPNMNFNFVKHQSDHHLLLNKNYVVFTHTDEFQDFSNHIFC